jgi:hypothetical protein
MDDASKVLREFGLELIGLAEVLDGIGDTPGAQAFAEAAFLAAAKADSLSVQSVPPVPGLLRLRWADRLQRVQTAQALDAMCARPDLPPLLLLKLIRESIGG